MPTGITHLKFGKHFSQSISHLPPKLSSLECFHSNDYDYKNFPSSLTSFKLDNLHYDKSFQGNLNYLPNSLTSLSIVGILEITILPPNLQFLEIRFANRHFKLPSLPSSLTRLEMSGNIPGPPFKDYKFPSNLKIFRYSIACSVIPASIPPIIDSVTKLILPITHGAVSKKNLPPNLEFISLILSLFF